MNYEEEQEMELEALTSIFEEGKEFERCSPTEFKLKLLPNPAGEGENHVAVTLHVTYTATYPEEAPEWALEDVKMPDEKIEELKAKVEETIESSLGMAMIYTVAEACQDFLRDNNVKALSMHEEMMKRLGGGEDEAAEGEGDEEDDDEEEEDEEEWKGLADKTLCQESDRITVEQFNDWRVKFDEEMIAAGVLKRNEVKAKTGKLIFIEAQKAAQTAGAIADASGNGKDGNVAYNPDLFGEVDDMDLEEVSDED
jgi:hypothetical protein